MSGISSDGHNMSLGWHGHKQHACNDLRLVRRQASQLVMPVLSILHKNGMRVTPKSYRYVTIPLVESLTIR